ncbi:hypothetical protein GCM10020218_095200 [Dactylosporangium vinaceum]
MLQRQPYPVPSRPVYLPPPPPPQVLYYPVVPPPMMPMIPLRKGPWSIRWPAGFMTAYAVVLYVGGGLLLLLAGVLNLFNPPPDENISAEDIERFKVDGLEWGAIGLVAATLLINAAARARRPARGHHWYPLALCVIVAVSNLALSAQTRQAGFLIAAVIFILSTAMLLLPGSRRWMRRPPRPPQAPARS